MSLLTRAVRELRSTITKETVWGSNLSSPAEYGLTYGSGGMSHAGVSVTHEVAMTFSAVFACVRLISDTIASMPVDLLERYPGARYQRPLPSWMVTPNPEMSWQSFVQQVVTALLLDGNAYFIPLGENRGKVTELWPLDPRKVEVGRSKSGELVYLVREQPVAAKTLVHIRGLTLPGYLKGLSPVECARNAIGLGLSAEKHGSKLFANGATFDTVIKAKQKLNRQLALELARGFARDHSGDSAFIPPVIDQDAEIQHFSMTAEEVQFLSTRQFQVEEVARWYGVPPHRIALTEKTTSWGSGIEQQNIAFLTDALLPKLVAIEAALTPLVRLENPNYYVKFNASALLRGDMAARKDFYKTMWEIGAFSQDNILALEDMNPLLNNTGQMHFVPMNYQPTADAGLATKSNVVGELVRAGYDPEQVLKVAGMPSIKHLNVQPVTVRPIDGKGTQLAPAKTDQTAGGEK